MRNTLFSAAMFFTGLILALLPSIASASEGFDQGVAEAKADLAKNRGYLYAYGLRTPNNLDQQYGLPVRGIAGCIVNQEIQDRAKGYNETVAAWIKANGLPVNSRKKWLAQFKDLPQLWAAVDSFKPTDKPTASPDAPYTVKVTAVDEKHKDMCALELKTDNGQSTITLYGTHPQIVWGPAGSKTMVVRTHDGSPDGRYVLIDLQDGYQLDMQIKPIDHQPTAAQTRSTSADRV